ncbi:CBS domain-containing protein [Nonomuraea sp. LPB2021202275-12-8]|uniref:CBS domain-containing protein n=1 Tax=Nonomuraea sp. LPB2021202275-12-8 TaxID=3120159 RepID=UPI00300D83BC
MCEDVRLVAEPRAWMIRGGREGQREARALREGLVIVGWHEAGDLSRYPNREQLAQALRLAFPTAALNVISNWTGQLWRFTTEIRAGDLVVMPLKSPAGHIAIGKVTGSYEYRAHEPEDFQQVRTVDWLRWDVPLTAIRPDLRASLSSLLTVCGLTRNNAASRIADIADTGVDPGLAGEEEVTSADELLEDAASRDPASPRQMTIRSLLEHWGQRRRTGPVIATIKADLANKGLTTRPPFTEGTVSDEIALIPLGTEPGSGATTVDDTTNTEDVSEPEHMSLRLGSLPTPLVSVPSTATLTYAKTLMVQRRFSQIAVIDSDGTYHGAISWESIGRAHIAANQPSLQAATVSARVVDHDALLLDQIEAIYADGFIFVRDADRLHVTGILTAADLTGQFGSLARPFVLIEEAENRLRRVTDEVFTVDDLRDAVQPHRKSKVHRAADLTFGDYIFLLKDPQRWSLLQWQLDHQLFLAHLDEVREIRNDLMHFTPDPLSHDQYGTIEGLLSLLRTVDPRP